MRKFKRDHVITEKTFMVPVRSDYLEYALNYIKQVLEAEAMEPYDDDIWRELKHSLEYAERLSREYNESVDFNTIILGEESQNDLQR